MGKDKKTDEVKERLEGIIADLMEQVEYLEKALKLASERSRVKVEIDGKVTYEGDAAAFIYGIVDDKKVTTHGAGKELALLYLVTVLYKRALNKVGN